VASLKVSSSVMLKDLDYTTVTDCEIFLVQKLGISHNLKVIGSELRRLYSHSVAIEELDRHTLTMLSEEGDSLSASFDTVKHVPDSSTFFNEVSFLKLS